MLVGAEVEAEVPVVVVDVAGLREAVEQREHVLEAVAVQLLVVHGQDELVGGGERDLGDDRERRVVVDERHQLDALALRYLGDELLETRGHRLPRVEAVRRQSRMLVALLLERATDELDARVAAQQVDVARQLRVELAHVDEECARIDDVARC